MTYSKLCYVKWSNNINNKIEIIFLKYHMKWPRYTTKVLVDLLLERRRKGKAIKVVDSFHIHNTHFGGSRVLREQKDFLKWQSFLHKSEKLIHIWEKSTHHYLDNAPN